MAKEKAKTKLSLGLSGAFGQFFAIFGLALVVSVSGNLGLGPLLIGLGLATIVSLIFARNHHSIWATPAFLFLPALIIFSRGLETLPIGSPVWNFRIGGLLVSLWVSGLVYIVLATIVRYIGATKMRRIFSPIFSGIIIVLLAFSVLPRVIQFAYLEPLQAASGTSVKLIIIMSSSFLGYLMVTIFSKKPGAQARYALLIGIASGVVATTLIDAIELLWLSRLLENTIFFKQFTPGMYDGVPLTVFHNLEASFGFWQYLHFDLESMLLFVPLVLVAVSEHIHAMTKYVLQNKEGDQNADAAKTLIGEGISILIGGMTSGYPLTIDENIVHIATSSKKSHLGVVIPLAVLMVGLGIFIPFSYTLTLIPLPVIGGVLIAWAGYEAALGFSRVSSLVHDQLHPLGTSLSLVVLGLGMTLVIFEFISDYLGDSSLRFMIGTTPFPSYLIVIVIAFIINLFFPKLVVV